MLPNLKFDHIGIVVADLSSAVKHFASVIDAVGCTRRFDDPALTVSVQFLTDSSGTVYELIAPLGEQSIVSGALKKRQNLLNQLAYKTQNLDEAVFSLRKLGYFPIGAAHPAVAFDGAKVQFLHSPLDFIVELIEENGHCHAFHRLSLDPT